MSRRMKAFYYHESNNIKNNSIENDDFMSRYIYKPYSEPLINLDRLIITGKYQI